ncbi:phage integrase N-terminal SAM-like domain-containing protein [Desulfitobacterium sp. Sab5]|uniref:phage integrase N-terminal SAM-like domain-containing protein n=1 Tax=Desulfitobacterium nosdiversum TaxID=3375356 RepID=UPI003CEB206E
MDHISSWLYKLEEEGKSPNTLRAYRQRLNLFQSWFEETNEYPFAPDNVTPTDLREYKSFLQNVQKRKAQTVNLTLNAIESWLTFNDKVVKAPPRVKTVKGSPQALDKKEKHALMRAVERAGDRKANALITMFLNTAFV